MVLFVQVSKKFHIHSWSGKKTGEMIRFRFALKKKSTYICDTLKKGVKIDRWCNWQHV